MKRLVLYSYGSLYKLILSNINETSTSNTNTKNASKLLNNIIRAKTNISNKVLCNDFYYFCTITVNSKHDREDLSYIRSSINNKLRKLRKKFNLNLKYIFIPEKHKKGGYHLHGLLSSDFEQFVYTNENGYESLKITDYLGFSSVSVIKDKEKVSSYVTKYVTKDFDKREVGKHCYFSSKGLNKPSILHKIEIYDLTLEELKKYFQFTNEYCSMSSYKELKPAFEDFIKLYLKNKNLLTTKKE